MNAFGYLFILSGIVLIRQVIVGRVMDTPSDAKELALAFANGDMASVSEVLSRRGTNVEEASASYGEVATIADASSTLLNECMRLGGAAKGYRLGSTGPDYYDCSGLVWRAMRNLGIYSGLRFTTHVFDIVANREGWQPTSNPQIGDVILWPNKHMGIAAGEDRMYSARSTSKGIGMSSVSGDTSYFGFQPRYYRITPSATGGRKK